MPRTITGAVNKSNTKPPGRPADAESRWRSAGPERLAGFTGKRFAPHRWFVMLAKLATRGKSYAVFEGLSYGRRLFRPYIAYNARLMPFGTLARRETELLILRTAWVCGSPYEWGQHVPIGRKEGLTADDIERIKGGPNADGLAERDRVLLAACDELLSDRVVGPETWAALRPLLDDGQIVEFCMLVGSYAGLAGTLNTLGVQLESGNRPVS